MAPGVIKLTLYGPDDEVVGEFKRGFIPWKLLKRAVRLSRQLGKTDVDEISDDLLDSLAELVVDFFGGQFTSEDLENGADAGEMMAVLQSILSRAGELNPIKPG